MPTLSKVPFFSYTPAPRRASPYTVEVSPSRIDAFTSTHPCNVKGLCRCRETPYEVMKSPACSVSIIEQVMSPLRTLSRYVASLTQRIPFFYQALASPSSLKKESH